ncbi:MAG: hypothetical protein QNL12_15835 [Acidimicrobiia bacterium]|nr:hypothetical protein [Acidimicrobiia bacterium]MDX2468783.1 hypothetical protein [Acidimicrobiia bacterium]
MAPIKRFILLLCLSVFVLASCGGADDDTSATSTASEGAAATTTSTTISEPSTEATTTTTTTADSATGMGKIDVVFDDGRSWTFDGFCTYTPDNTGPASALWNIEAEDAADGSSFVAIMAFPFDPEKKEPVLIGTMVDADENLYVAIEVEDVSDGSNLILNLGFYEGVFKAIGDPIDITATVTCGIS